MSGRSLSGVRLVLIADRDLGTTSSVTDSDGSSLGHLLILSVSFDRIILSACCHYQGGLRSCSIDIARCIPTRTAQSLLARGGFLLRLPLLWSMILIVFLR
jgi:hypothetical protein